MAFVPTFEKVVAYDDNGVPIMYVEGTHKNGDTLPTTNISQGSNSIDLDNKTMEMFNGTAWGTLFVFPNT